MICPKCKEGNIEYVEYQRNYYIGLEVSGKTILVYDLVDRDWDYDSQNHFQCNSCYHEPTVEELGAEFVRVEE